MQSVRAISVPMVCVVALLVGACSGEETGTGSKSAERQAVRPSGSSSPGSSESAEEHAREDLIAKRLADLPRLDRSLPRFLPETFRGESIVDSPPGRTRLVFHPVESHDDPLGWVGEELLFLSVDGEWSSLRMADLRLPDSAWPGVDTYGAGELSPDGWWWATHTNSGVILMDLRTGKWDLVDVGFAVSDTAWSPDSSRLLATKSGRPPTAVIKVSSGLVSFANRNLMVGMEPPRTPASIRNRQGGAVWLRYDLTGRVTSKRPVPDEWFEESGDVLATTFGEDQVAIDLMRSPVGPSDMLVVDSGSLEHVALLRVREGHERWLATHGWDPRGRILIGVDSGVMAWDPSTGDQFQVIRARSPAISREFGALAWTVTIATDTFND